MADALGINAVLLGKTESVYGTPPAGDYAKLRFVSSTLDSKQSLRERNLMGTGRDAQTPTRGSISVDGDVVVPLDSRNIGQWLFWLLGSETNTGGGPYVHTWKSGANSLPSFSLEVGFPDVGQYILESGLRVDKMSLNWHPDNDPDATFSLIGQKVSRSGLTVDDTPTVAVYDPFSGFEGGISKNGVALANILSASLTYSNNCEVFRPVRADGLITDVRPLKSTLTGDIEVRFTDTALLGLAESGTPCSLAFSYTIDANTSLVITAHEVHLPKAAQTINGIGGVQARYSFQAAYNTAAGCMATFVLTNSVPDYS